ncbi:MAG: hypothetical protein M1828_001740 [Chrysothrix sp. TS-e1954]|nr:MAG: hypothetical protein M1828_001740 [Chrysothrix sp. TS-e1954]
MSGLSEKLAPQDHGKAAWLTLLACFFVEGLIWSLPFSYGVFQLHYESHPPFVSHPGGLPAVGTTTTGVAYFFSPVIALIIQRWQASRKPCAFIGLVLIAVALVGASFARKVTDLIATQGVLFGLGTAFIYNPFVFYLDDWFDKRMGFAYGCLWAGTGLGGLVTPLLMGWGLDRFGFRTMLRAWSILIVITILPLIMLMKPRQATSPPVMPPLKTRLAFFLSVAFWILQAGNIVEGLGYFMPSIFLPTYASSLGVSRTGTHAVTSVQNCASIVGTIIFGLLVDKFHVSTVWLLSTLGTTLVVLVLWGLSSHETQALLWVFTVMYGIFAGGFTALWTGVAKILQSEDRYKETATAVLLGVFAAGRGVGNVVSGPVSEQLIGKPLSDSASFAYGTKYGALIVFTGVTAFISGIGWVARFVGHSQATERSHLATDGGDNMANRLENLAQTTGDHVSHEPELKESSINSKEIKLRPNFFSADVTASCKHF